MTCRGDGAGCLRKQKQGGEAPGAHPGLPGKGTFEQRLEGAEGGGHAGKSIGNSQCGGAELRGGRQVGGASRSPGWLESWEGTRRR